MSADKDWGHGDVALTHRGSSGWEGRRDGTGEGNWPESTLVFLPAACLGRSGGRKSSGQVDRKSQGLQNKSSPVTHQ